MTARARHRINVHDLQGELVRSQDAVEELIEEYQNAAETENRARATWETARARTLLTFRGERTSEDLRNAAVYAEHGALFEDWQHTKVNLEVVRRAARAAETRVEVVRSLVASERALMS